MPAYVISKAEPESAVAKTLSSWASRKLVLLPAQSPVSLKAPPVLSEDGAVVAFTVSERVECDASYLGVGRVKVELETSVACGIGLRSKAVAYSPRGPGVVTKGGSKRYIDKQLGPILIRAMKGEYGPYEFSKPMMDWRLWGDELRALCVEAKDVGRIEFHGEISKADRTGPVATLIRSGDVESFSVKSNLLKRTVGVARHGVIRGNLGAPESVLRAIDEVFEKTKRAG